jgi:hypothetical protein
MPLSLQLARRLRKIFFALAIALTVVAVAITIENWRGDRAWRQTLDGLQAKGITLDPASVRPPHLPDEQNFFKSPPVANVLQRSGGIPGGATFPFIDASSANGQWHRGSSTDFATVRTAWKKRSLLTVPDSPNAAADVLAVFDRQAAVCDEIRACIETRPRGQQDPFPGFAQASGNPQALFFIARTLSQRASAKLALGRSDEAYQDTLAALRIARGFAEWPPSLLSSLLGSNTAVIAIQPAWEAAQRHAWSELQWSELQTLFTAVRPLQSYHRAVRNEEILALGFIDLWGMPRDEPQDRGLSVCSRIVLAVSRGWKEQNKVTVVHAIEDDAFGPLDLANERVSTVALARARAQYSARTPSHSPHRVFALLVELPPMLDGLADASERLVLARTGCALERYYVRHGRYPQTLDQLVPAFIERVPTSTYDDRHLRFEQTGDGNAVLSSSPDSPAPPAMESNAVGSARLFQGDWSAKAAGKGP